MGLKSLLKKIQPAPKSKTKGRPPFQKIHPHNISLSKAVSMHVSTSLVYSNFMSFTSEAKYIYIRSNNKQSQVKLVSSHYESILKP